MTRKAKIYGDFFNEKDISEIEKALENIPHEEQQIRNILSNYEIEKYFHKMMLDDLIGVMF